MRPLALLVVLAAGCSNRTEVQITLAIDSAIAVSSLRAIELVVSGDEALTRQVALPAGFDADQARFIYRPGIQNGTLDFRFTAIGDGDVSLGHGEVSGVRVTHGKATRVDVTLRADASLPDLSVADLSVADLVTTDLRVPDLAPGGPSLCPGVNLAFCEGFEAGAINTTLWGKNVTAGNSTVDIDPTQHYRGQASLRAHAEGVSPQYIQALIRTTLPFKPAYVRLFAKLPSAPPAMAISVFDVPGGGAVYLSTHATGTLRVAGVSPGFEHVSAELVTRDVWHCFEWKIDDGSQSDAGTGEIRAWLDGAEVPAVRHTPFDASGFVGLSIGVELVLTAGTQPFDVFIDEVAIDDQPIGCAN
jgi:hypothetical protein